jgi:ligand-binding sensor domain-containing protein/two-component sensor histidine kinase
MRCLFIILSFLGVLQIKAQTNQPLFRKLSDKNGLSSNRITCFLKDSKGYLWVGTDFGLNRYDGIKFEKFFHSSYNPATISSNLITCLAEDSSGQIWIGTEADGLNCYNYTTRAFTHWQKNGSTGTIQDNHILSLMADKKGGLWIGYKLQGWSRLQINTGQLQHENSGKIFLNVWGQNAANIVQGFSQTTDGTTWIIQDHGLVKRLANGKQTFFTDNNSPYNPQNDNLFIAIQPLGDTALLIGTWGCGIKKFNIKTERFTHYLFDKQYGEGSFTNIVLGIGVKNKDEYWVATADRGLGIFHLPTGEFRFFKHVPADSYSPPPDECRVVYTDKEGVLWAGFDAGFCFWAPSLQNFHFTEPIGKTGPNNLNSTVTATYYHGKESCFYFGREFGIGLYTYNEKTAKHALLPFPEWHQKKWKGAYIYHIGYWQNNVLLLRTNAAWLFFNLQSQTYAPVYFKQGAITIEAYGASSTIDEEGCFWCWDAVGNYYKIDAKTLQVVVKGGTAQNGKYPFNQFSRLVGIASKNQLWVHDRHLGLCLLNTATNQIDSGYLTDQQKRIFDAKEIERDKRGHFWVTTYSSGLYEMWKLSNGTYTYKHYTQEQGLPELFLDKICIDSSQQIWLSAKSGIIKTNTTNPDFKLYSSQEGYNSQWTLITQLQLGDAGRLLISHRKGFTWLPAYAMEQNKVPPKLFIGSVKINNQDYTTQFLQNSESPIKLESNQNNLSISIVALNLINANQNQYAYRFIAKDSSWTFNGNNRDIVFASLKPGNYLLQIKAANNDGIWTSNYLELKFTIQWPIWQRWWFILLIAAGLTTLIYLAYRFRLKAVRKEEQLKNEFSKKMAEVEMKALRAQMNPHFIFNSLNSINRYIIKSDQATASNYLTRFAKLIRLILDSSANDTTSLEKELQLLQLYIEMEQLRFENRFEVNFITEENIHPEKILIPSMLIQPYIENAIWHGLLHKEEKGKLLIEFKLVNKNIFEVTIEDNGIGRKKAAELKSKEVLKEKSYGMAISGDRLKIVNQLYNQQASCEVVDLFDEYNRPCGTRVILKLPVIEIKT